MNNKFINRDITKRQNFIFKKILRLLLILVTLGGVGFLSFYFINKNLENKITLKTIKSSWESYDYQAVYENGKAFLQENPFNNTALTYYSYACFYLAVAQNDTSLAENYLDECINNLRIAMYDASSSLLPQLQYMLGKAYFYKNTVSTYYYSDLSIKYLNLAKENGYKADDIPEYLGLSYAALGMPMESISAFSEALLIRESDTLLFSIAEQYYKAKQNNASKQYLFRVIQNNQDDELVQKSRILLGNIYLEEKDFENAEKEFNNVLLINKNSADAHYGIGVIYEQQGNIAKARAEWRSALKIQVNHPGALKKLSDK